MLSLQDNFQRSTPKEYLAEDMGFELLVDVSFLRNCNIQTTVSRHLHPHEDLSFVGSLLKAHRQK